ncbi:MAG: acetylxylan esterase [Bryobacteraceae bacterium]
MPLAILFLALPLLLALPAAAAPVEDARNTRVVTTDTHFRMPDYGTLERWERRKRELRERILFTAGLDPMPARGPVRAEVFGRLDRDGYSIEKVLLETMPGYYLGGNLYRPRGAGAKFPAIVTPHGHWVYGRLEHSDTGSIPARAINLARQGFVVFAYDMVGYNDTIQTPHDFAGKQEQLWNFGPLGLQLWNSLRAVDWIATLPDVDPARIGATGASGGGTQTFLLAAVDERIQYAAPVNMISAIMQGGSPCENMPGLRVGAFNVEYGAMMAPRPMLMVSATGDWTRNTLEEEYPAVKGIYSLYGKADSVTAVRIDAPHNYNKDSREAVYRFFAKQAQKDPGAADRKEKSVRVEKLQDMLALHNHPLPPGALSYDALFAQWRSNAREQVNAIADKAERRRLLGLALGTVWPEKVEDREENGRRILSRPGAGDAVPALWKAGKGAPLLVVHPDGATAAMNSSEARQAIAGGRPVLAIDAFQTGSAKAPRDRSHRHFTTFQRTDDAERAQDIVTAMAWLRAAAPGEPEVIGLGDASIWVRFAAAVAPGKIKLSGPSSAGFAATDDELIAKFFVPGIQRAGGWASALLLTE